MSKKKKNINEYSCIQKDETVVKVGSELIWLWVAIKFEYGNPWNSVSRAKYVGR